MINHVSLQPSHLQCLSPRPPPHIHLRRQALVWKSFTCSSLSRRQPFPGFPASSPVPTQASLGALSTVTFCEKPACLAHLRGHSNNATLGTPRAVWLYFSPWHLCPSAMLCISSLVVCPLPLECAGLFVCLVHHHHSMSLISSHGMKEYNSCIGGAQRMQSPGKGNGEGFCRRHGAYRGPLARGS